MTTFAIPVFVNRHGGTARARGDKLGDELEQAFAAAGLAIDLQLIDGGAIGRAVAGAAKDGHRLIAVGGGDGTIGCAAGALLKAGGEGALAVLPLGTRNHLARDLGLPNDLAEIAQLIAGGVTRSIDLGEVNAHVFVNNASIGFYPEMVRRREAEQERRGLPKWLAYGPAAWAVLKRARHHRLRLRMKGDEREVRTPLLFVGNNRYALEPGKLGRRDSLQDGLLSVYALEGRTSPAMIGFALRTLIGRADLERDFAMVGDSGAFQVLLHNRAVDVALDGEVVRLAGPLRFRIVPGALKVIAPPALE